MDLQKKKSELEKEIKILEVRYHQLVGAVSMINEQLTETSASSPVTETETDGTKTE